MFNPRGRRSKSANEKRNISSLLKFPGWKWNVSQQDYYKSMKTGVFVYVCVCSAGIWWLFVRPAQDVCSTYRSWVAVCSDTSVSLCSLAPVTWGASSVLWVHIKAGREATSQTSRGQREGCCWQIVLLLFPLDACQYLEEVLFPWVSYFNICH